MYRCPCCEMVVPSSCQRQDQALLILQPTPQSDATACGSNRAAWQIAIGFMPITNRISWYRRVLFDAPRMNASPSGIVPEFHSHINGQSRVMALAGTWQDAISAYHVWHTSTEGCKPNSAVWFQRSILGFGKIRYASRRGFHDTMGSCDVRKCG
jgi:hypothetical protein